MVDLAMIKICAVRAVVGAGALLLLTIAHHVYGAVIYATPWRYHVVPPALLTALMLMLALLVLLWRPNHRLARAAAYGTVFLIALVPVALFGLYEGGYNHVAKNLLFFSGAPETTLRQWFPPPIYELPNDVVFEVTGVLQALVAPIVGLHAWQLLRALTAQRQLPNSVQPAPTAGAQPAGSES